MKSARILMPLLVLGVLGVTAPAQSLDNSGNSMLSGTYYFRQVFYAFDNEGDFVDAASLYGNITFSGNGTYSVSGSVCDYENGCTSTATPLTTTGTYVIGANGFGYISSPYVSGDLIYGLVSRGIFVGATTETTQLYNDLFIAAPIGSSPATNSTFSGTYSIAYTDPTLPVDALFQVSPNGSGSLGTINASGYYESGFNANGTVAYSAQSQTLNGVTYAFSNGAASVNLGGNGSLLPTNVLLYISPDGNFVFGGAYNGFDMFVGVRNGTGATNFNGLYYQAGLDSDLAQFDTYYGALDVFSSGTILDHQRLAQFGDYTFYDSYSLSGNTYDDTFLSQHYIFGAGGAIRIGYGQSYSGYPPTLGINVAIQAPSFSGSGVYLNPTGVVNDGSFAPFTAHLAPGELIALFGTGLASGTASATTLPLPNQLGGVQVFINGYNAPLVYVSPTQINAVVPYEVSNVASIHVLSNGQSSNTVTELMNATSAGVFTYSPADGTGFAAALHQDYTVVSPSNPAQPGETIQVYVTGLGAVTPSPSSDGAPGSSISPYNTTTNTIMADINGTAASIGFSGLAPGFAGVYQLNIAIPTGLTAPCTTSVCDYDLDIEGPDSYTQEAVIPIGSGGAVAAEPGPEPQARSVTGQQTTRAVKKHGRQVHGSMLHRSAQ